MKPMPRLCLEKLIGRRIEKMARKLKVTLVRSPIHRTESQKETVRGLGLRRLHRSRVLQDTPSIRGMIRKVQHLVTVEPADESLRDRKSVQRLLAKAAKRRGSTMYHPRFEFIDAAILGRISGLLTHWDELEEIERSNEPAEGENPWYLSEEAHTTSKDTGGDKSFTIRQHLVPRFHIARFVPEGKGKVWAFFLKEDKIDDVPARSERFCASRLWSHSAESHWMGAVEQLFNQLVPELPEVIHDPVAQDAITEYWALCRSRIKVFGKQPKAFNFPTMERLNYDDASRNKAEKMGLGLYSTRGDETRTITDALIGAFMDGDDLDFRNSGLRWIVADAIGAPLVLPDHWESPIIPITPTRFVIAYKGRDDLFHAKNQPAESLNEVLGTRNGKNFIVSSSKDTLLEIQKKRKAGSSV